MRSASYSNILKYEPGREYGYNGETRISTRGEDVREAVLLLRVILRRLCRVEKFRLGFIFLFILLLGLRDPSLGFEKSSIFILCGADHSQGASAQRSDYPRSHWVDCRPH